MPVSGNSVVTKGPRLVPGTFLLRDQVVGARPLDGRLAYAVIWFLLRIMTSKPL